MKQRLQKIIAQAGIASRRAAEKMIEQGRVSLNGITVTRLGTTADPWCDRVEVDGTPVHIPSAKLYIMLHKPPGCVTTVQDPEGRPTVMKFFEDISERIYPVGRLDYDTEGLLVLTNDGEFAHLLMHPRFGLHRTYAVKVHGMLSRTDIDRLSTGIRMNGVPMTAQSVTLIRTTGKNTWLELILGEGRNHQIKKMFEAIGYRTMRIIRVGFGPLQLGTLPPGSWRRLTKQEVSKVKAAAGASPIVRR